MSARELKSTQNQIHASMLPIVAGTATNVVINANNQLVISASGLDSEILVGDNVSLTFVPKVNADPGKYFLEVPTAIQPTLFFKTYTTTIVPGQDPISILPTNADTSTYTTPADYNVDLYVSSGILPPGQTTLSLSPFFYTLDFEIICSDNTASQVSNADSYLSGLLKIETVTNNAIFVENNVFPTSNSLYRFENLGASTNDQFNFQAVIKGKYTWYDTNGTAQLPRAFKFSFLNNFADVSVNKKHNPLDIFTNVQINTVLIVTPVLSTSTILPP